MSVFTRLASSLACLLIAVAASRAQQIALPVEALSATTAEPSRILPAGLDYGAVDHLYLRVHGLAYVGEASVRVNGGAWVDLTDAHVTFPDNQYGGIGGGYHTLRFRVPASELGAFAPGGGQGEPRIRFRFNGTDGESLGFRVIAFNLRDGGGRELIDRDLFRRVNPGTWSAPVAGADAAERGRRLWLSAGLLDRPGPEGLAIRATCGDCHARNGEDLEYYAYSNRAIVERSKFHGLTEGQGELIASYIRSLSADGAVSGRRGRPWNPPYQPGPALADAPASAWAAGAGLAAVGNDERDLIAGFLPGGTSPEAIAARVHPDASIDLTVVPIPRQFPDWNDWLPRVHPKDVWQGTYFDDSDANAAYVTLARDLAANKEAVFRAGNYLTRIGAIQQKTRTFLSDGRRDNNVNGGSNWRTQLSNATDAIRARYKPGGSAERAKENLAKWVAVKYWEVMHPTGLETRGRDLWPDADRWQQPITRQTVHQVAPHIIADNLNNVAGEDPLASEYMSSIWYQLQMTLNSGEGIDRDLNRIVEPVDWPYQNRHIWELGERTPAKRYDGMRYYLTLAKMFQMCSNDNGPNRQGWLMRFVQPTLVSAMTRRGQFQLMDVPDAYEDGLSAKLQTALLDAWLIAANSYDESQWLRQTSKDTRQPDKWDKLEPRGATPSMKIPGLYNFEFWSTSKMNHMNHLYRLIPLLEERGQVDCRTIRGLAEWGEARWPKGDWLTRLREPTCAAAPSSPAAPEPEPPVADAGGPPAQALSAVVRDGDDVHVAWGPIPGIGCDGFVLQRARQAPVGQVAWNWLARLPCAGPQMYRYVDRDREPGTYLYRVRQRDGYGKERVTRAAPATVNDDGVAARAWVEFGNVRVTGLANGTAVTVSDVLGRELARGIVDDTEYVLDVSEETSGLIVVYYRPPGGRGTAMMRVMNQ